MASPPYSSMRDLFLEMNGRALAAEDPGPEAELPSAWDRLEQIAVPTLVLIGDLDLEDIREQAEGLATRIPNARLEVLEATAHLPQLEAHPRCLAAVRAFLA